jgi:hypothetical protein
MINRFAFGCDPNFVNKIDEQSRGMNLIYFALIYFLLIIDLLIIYNNETYHSLKLFSNFLAHEISSSDSFAHLPIFTYFTQN